MRARTPVDRAVATYCDDWPRATVDQSGIAMVNPETLGNTTPPEFTFRYIDISSVSEGAIDWRAVPRLRFADAPSRARRVVRPGDTFICTVRPLLRSHAFAHWLEEESTVCSTGFAVVRCASGLVPSFLKHLPFLEQVTRQLVAWQCGTNYPAVNERDIRRLVVPVPPPDEQAAIARILDTVDTALERTRAAVMRARVLRDSLIHELLARGLRRERPKKSPAGLIPTSWDCDLLGQHIQEGPTNGVYRPESDYHTHGVPIVRIDDFSEGQIHDLATLRRVTVEPIIQERYALAEGDVLINRVNSLSHIGKAALVPPIDEPTIFESNMMRLRCTPRLLPAYLIIVLCSDVARRHWLARAKPAVNQASINQRDVRELQVPIPDPDEQREVARLIAASTNQIEHLEAVSEAQQTLKKSLMHDLLTGRVRVTSEIESAIS